MSSTNFYSEQSESSRIKCEIITKYFIAWFNVIKNTTKKYSNRVFYADLFCGPGIYDDGSKSTPIRILETAVKDIEMRNMLVTLFNDKEKDYTEKLKKEIKKIPNIDSLKYKPKIITSEINQEIVDYFLETNLVPTFSFIDPWGYKGLTRDLLKSLIKDWGSDCVFFFNYNRIEPAIKNRTVEDHIIALFGKKRFDHLYEIFSKLKHHEREAEIIEQLNQALLEIGGKYSLPFCFKQSNSHRTSHYLIFTTKHIRGYKIMKDIMAPYSSESHQGVPNFQYIPATVNQPLLFELFRPLDDLGDMLLNEFQGKTIRMEDLYNNHHIGKPFIEKNYKDILVKLEEEGKISSNSPLDNRQKRYGKPTCANHIEFTFPVKE